MSLTKATNSMIAGAPINPRDNGAIGDGVADDTAALQKSLDDALALNLPISFTPGTYNHTGLSYTGGNLTLIGNGAVLNFTGAGTTDAFVVKPIANTVTENLSINGLTFKNGKSCFKVEANGTGIFRKGFINSCVFDTSTSGMAWFEHCENFVIDGNQFYNASDNAIYYSFSRNAVISNNFVLNCQGSGAITVGYQDTVITKCENINIIGNEITTNADAPATVIVYQAGIDAVFCSNVLIADNHISNSYNSVAGRKYNAGIVAEEFFIENLTIQGNKIWNIPYDGIRLGFSSGSTLTKVKILNNDIMTCQNAVQLSNTFAATIAGNSFRRLYQEAIEVMETCGAIEIVGNTITDASVQSIYGAKAAIEIAGHNVLVRGNTFIDGEFGGYINSSATSPTYSVDGNGVITLYESGVSVKTIDTTGLTWELVKNAINARAGWQLSLYPYCNSTYVEDIRRTGYRNDNSVQQYSVGNHLGSPEPYGYVNVQSTATGAQIFNNEFKTRSLTLPNHHRNTLLYDFTGGWDGKDVNQYGGGRVFFDAAAPTGGYGIIGDIVYNNTPAVGQPKGWVCTVSGSPGTWVSLGNL